jgi:hypothetical protein
MKKRSDIGRDCIKIMLAASYHGTELFGVLPFADAYIITVYSTMFRHITKWISKRAEWGGDTNFLGVVCIEAGAINNYSKNNCCNGKK